MIDVCVCVRFLMLTKVELEFFVEFGVEMQLFCFDKWK